MTHTRQVLLSLALLVGLLIVAGGVATAANTGYIGTGSAYKIYRFDTSTYQTTSEMVTDNGAIDVLLSPGGDKLYMLGVNKIEVYSTSSGLCTGSINIGFVMINKGTLKLSPAGDKLYAVVDRYVYTINTAAFTLTSNNSISSTYNGAGYADLAANGQTLYIPIGYDLVCYSTTTGTVTNTYTMPYPLTSALYDNSKYIVILGTTTAHAVLVTDHPMVSGTITHTINLSGDINHLAFTPDTSQIIAADYDNSRLVFIDANNYTIVANLSIGARPFKITPNQDNNKEFIICSSDSLVKVVDPSSRSVISTIVLPQSVTSIAVPKFNSEGTQYYAPHPVKFHLTNFIRDQNNITANVTNRDGDYVESGRTGTDGVVVFQLYSDKWYTVTFQDGSTWEGYPADSQYDILYLGFSLGDILNPGSGAPGGHEDQLKEITATYDGTLDSGTATGTLTCLYNDTSTGTTSVNFTLYHRNTTSGQYEYLDSEVVNANNASAIFTIQDASGQGYKVVITATSSYYGEVARSGDYTFDGGYTYDMGWPSYLYVAFVFIVSLIIGFNTSRDFYITLGGGTLFIGFNWCFYMIGWTSGMGLIIPVGLIVCTIILALFAVAEWRTMNGV